MTDQVPGAQPAYAPAPPAIPGKTLGIVAVIVTFVLSSVVGLVLGYVARGQSREVGYDNVPAKVAIIGGWIITGLAIVAGIIMIILVFVAAGAVSTYSN